MTDSVETIPCSNCKKDILSMNFVIHEIHCQRNLYLCSKCNEPVNHEQRTEHDKANHVLVYCPSCHTQIEKYLLTSHLNDDCPLRNVKCKICDVDIGARDITEHENYCGARTEKCSECGEFVMLKYKQLHIDSNHTFLKLSDEPGPSPSWQNGRRTLGNFFPDLNSGHCMKQSFQKKRLGKNENVRCKTRESSEVTTKENKNLNLSLRIKDSSYLNKNDLKSPGFSEHGVADSSMKNCFANKYTNNRAGQNEAHAGEMDSVCKMRNVDGEPLKKGNTGRKPSNSSTFQREKNSIGDQGADSAQNQEKLIEEDPSVALAIRISRQLNGDLDTGNEEPLAQAIEENAAILSKFTFFDAIEKKKATSEKNMSKNVRSGKNLNRTPWKSHLTYAEDDSSDDDFLLYASKPDSDADHSNLPCQFCGSLYSPSALMPHQRECGLSPFEEFLESDNPFQVNHKKNRKGAMITCVKCMRMVPVRLYKYHQHCS